MATFSMDYEFYKKHVKPSENPIDALRTTKLKEYLHSGFQDTEDLAPMAPVNVDPSNDITFDEEFVYAVDRSYNGLEISDYLELLFTYGEDDKELVYVYGYSMPKNKMEEALENFSIPDEIVDLLTNDDGDYFVYPGAIVEDLLKERARALGEQFGVWSEDKNRDFYGDELALMTENPTAENMNKIAGETYKCFRVVLNRAEDIKHMVELKTMIELARRFDSRYGGELAAELEKRYSDRRNELLSEIERTQVPTPRVLVEDVQPLEEYGGEQS